MCQYIARHIELGKYICIHMHNYIIYKILKNLFFSFLLIFLYNVHFPVQDIEINLFLK